MARKHEMDLVWEAEAAAEVAEVKPWKKGEVVDVEERAGSVKLHTRFKNDNGWWGWWDNRKAGDSHQAHFVPVADDQINGIY